MKKNILFLVWVFAIGILIKPEIARADFFNDGRWYMDSSKWEELVSWDIDGRGNLVDQNNRLNFSTGTGWTDDYEAFRCYNSKWEFELNNDFEFNIGIHYNHTGTYDTDEGGIEIGLSSNWQGSDEPAYAFSIAAENWVSKWDGENFSNKNVFWTGMEIPNAETENWLKRTNADGVLYVRYDYSKDELQFQALEGSYPNWEAVGGSGYLGLRNEMGLSRLKVYFGGWSEGAGLDSGNAYFNDFNIVKGNVTPEPVSCALFLVGTGVLVLARKKKQKNKFTIPTS